VIEQDHAGEDDLTFFRRRPYARTRVRSAFPGEFPRKILKRARGRDLVVVVAIERDPITNEPKARGRSLHFAEGGRA
jgi:hypothetical protein